MLTAIQQQRAAAALDYRHWLTYGAQMTDANAASTTSCRAADCCYRATLTNSAVGWLVSSLGIPVANSSA